MPIRNRKSVARNVTPGQRIRELRNSRGLSQADLARTIYMDPATLSRIETGRVSPTIASYSRIAGALGVPLSQLLGGDL